MTGYPDDFESFKEYVKGHIKDYLPEKYADAKIEIKEMKNNNDSLMLGLTIRMKDCNIAPNIYLDSFYEGFKTGRSLEDIMRHLANIQTDHEPGQNFDISNITDYEKAKKKILCRLVNADMNKEYLSDKPHTRIEDLAVIYAVNLGSNGNGKMSAPITSELLSRYGISIKELHEQALINLSKLPVDFRTMQEIMMAMMGSDMPVLPPLEEGGAMYVLSNPEKLNGAAKILGRKVMDDMADKIGGDFVIIPSSINEVIILPVSADFDRVLFEDMVKEVNEKQVLPQGRLSNKVYIYDSKDHSFILAEKYMKSKEHRVDFDRETVENWPDNTIYRIDTGGNDPIEVDSEALKAAFLKADGNKLHVGTGKDAMGRSYSVTLDMSELKRVVDKGNNMIIWGSVPEMAANIPMEEMSLAR
ncbi:MAG: DUF5688 family protein [Lachnospiraceae bacterium]|nr:DUF5688 family protein [Lachnospiraceae bacterium]